MSDLTAAADLARTELRSHYHDLAADLLDPADLAQGDVAHAMHVALVDALVAARVEGRAEALRRGRLEGAASVKAEALSRILAERSQGDLSLYTHGTWDQGASVAASTVELIDLSAIVAALEQ